MNELEKFVNEQIKQIISDFEKLQFLATIGDTSYSIEFFVLINGKRKQCFELVDEHIIESEKLEKVFSNIEKFIRNSPDYTKDKINKFSFGFDE